MSSTLAGFYHRNQKAVLIAAAVATVGVGAGMYYTYSAAPAATGSSATPQTSSSTQEAKETEPSSQNKKKKNNDKKKNKKAKQEKAEEREKFGLPLKTYGKDGLEYPDVTADTDLRVLANEEKKEVARDLKAAGNAAFNSKDYEEAIKLYSSAIRCDNKEPIFYSNRAACYNSLGKYQNVIEDTTTALSLKPDYIKCLSRRAVAYEKSGNYSEAIFDFTASCILGSFNDNQLNSSVDRVLRLQAEKISQQEYSDKKDVFPSANFIKAYLTSFRARELPESVTAAVEGTGNYYLKLGFDALEQETIEGYKQARDYFGQAVDNKAEDEALALEMRGTFKFLLNDATGAMEDMEASIKKTPSVPAYIKRSSIYLENGSLEGSNQGFAEALKLDPNSADVFYHQAQVYFLTGNFQEAVTNYEKSISLDPSYMFSHVQLAVTQYRMQSQQVAIASFRKLLQQYPDSSEVHNYYGEILLDQSEFDEAIRQFDQAIEIETKKNAGSINVLCLVNKALAVYQKNTDMVEAEGLCRKAVTLDPHSDIALGTLAQFCLQLGKTEEAMKYFIRNAEIARNETERVQALQYAEAARTQLRIVKERPELRQKLEKLTAAGAS